MGFGILHANCTDCAVEGVTVLNTPGENAIVFGGSGGGARNLVRNCVIRNGGTSIPGNTHQTDFSAIYIDSSDTSVMGNRILHDSVPFTHAGGIELHGAGDMAADNYIEKSYPAMWVESDLPPGQSLKNIVVRHNTFADVHMGINLAGKGDFENLRIENNTITIRRFQHGPIAAVPSFAMQQPRDTSGVFNYSLVLRNSVFSNNTLREQDPLPAAAGSTGCIDISAVDGLTIAGNDIGPISGTAFFIAGSPYGTRRLTISGNTVRDFGQNTSSSGHEAFLIDLTGKSIRPPRAAFDADGITIFGNRVSVSAAHPNTTAFYWDWSKGSVIRNVVVAPTNTWSNLPYLFRGPKGKAAQRQFLQTADHGNR